MPSFSTSTPIDLAINLQVGAIHVVAEDRDDTVVTISASNPQKAVDQRGAEETRIDFDGQRLAITGPRPRVSWFGPTESVDVRVELPTHSRLTAEIGVGAVRTVGRLGNTRIKSSLGPVDIDQAGDVWLRASHGNATVALADGAVEIVADLGQIRVGSVTGDAVLKASHGSIVIDESYGEVEAKLSYGGLEIHRVHASVATKTSYGSIELREVSGGSINVESGFGEVSIGVKDGVPAWLDLSSKRGHVRNELVSEGAPEKSERTVAVRARTQFGDITIHRVTA